VMEMKSCIAAHVPQTHLTNNVGCSNNNGESSEIKPAKIEDFHSDCSKEY